MPRRQRQERSRPKCAASAARLLHSINNSSNAPDGRCPPRKGGIVVSDPTLFSHAVFHWSVIGITGRIYQRLNLTAWWPDASRCQISIGCSRNVIALPVSRGFGFLMSFNRRMTAKGPTGGGVRQLSLKTQSFQCTLLFCHLATHKPSHNFLGLHRR